MKKQLRNRTALGGFAAGVVILLAACGGGGGGDGSAAATATPDPVTIAGTAAKGLLSNARVTAWAVGVNGPADTPLAEGSTNAQRIAQVDALTAELERCLATRKVAQMLETFTDAGISCAPIHNVAQVLAEEQVAAVDMVVDVARRDGGNMRLLGVPFKFSATPARPGLAPPRLGEDTDAVLRRVLGLSDEAIARLRAAGAI